MSYRHEFGIIDSIHGEELHVEYMPERYGCVAVDGEEVEHWIEQLNDAYILSLLSLSWPWIG